MTANLLDRARAGDGAAFGQLVEPHRRNLMVHCYRMLGSMQDAEDALQETMLSAWRGLAGFEGRSSVRTWLYRVATSRCLNAQRAAAATARRGRAAGQHARAGPGPRCSGWSRCRTPPGRAGRQRARAGDPV